MPLPQNLQDIEAVARKHLGHSGNGKITLFHNSDAERVLRQPQDVGQISEGDHIVVRVEKDDGPTSVSFPRDLSTTHQAAFVKHAPIKNQRPATDRPAVAAEPSLPFTGRSCYSGDFVAHAPVKGNERVAPTTPAWDASTTIPMTAHSTYNDNYPWHKPSPDRPKRKEQTQQSAPVIPFNGESSYNCDFVRHKPVERPKQPTKSSPSEYGQEQLPFSGSTTYGMDFKKHQMERALQKKAERQETLTSETIPFLGTSEYNQQFIKKEQPRGPMVRIVPERRPSDPSSVVSRSSRGSQTSRPSRSNGYPTR